MSTKEVPNAGNQLTARRDFLAKSLVGASGLLTAQAAMGKTHNSNAQPIRAHAWMTHEGGPVSKQGLPSPFETQLNRLGIAARPGAPGSGGSRTPLQHLDGIVTPSRLHFERHHSGIPNINPDKHKLVIHGAVKQPLEFTLEKLQRYPHVSSLAFLECSGNSAVLLSPKPAQEDCGTIHGLVSNSEWSGVPLHYLLDEAGLTDDAKWLIAEGGDSALMSRSIPIDKALDDVIVATHQNGEPLRPSNGYPLRLFLPGWEGNMSIKWLRRLYLANQPAMTREETSKYSDLQQDGTVRQFTFVMDVKSVITSPSPGLDLQEKGVYQISGIAWSGHGKISKVEVSADAGKTWSDALLDNHVLDKSLTRFRTGWHWQGQPGVLLSRAYDDRGNVQSTRKQVLDNRARGTFYHVNPLQAWLVDSQGKVSNTYV